MAAPTVMIFPATAAPEKNTAMRFFCQQNFNGAESGATGQADLIRAPGREATARAG